MGPTFVVSLFLYANQRIRPFTTNKALPRDSTLYPRVHMPPVRGSRVVYAGSDLQPEYELPSSTRFRKFQKFGKVELKAMSLSHTLRKISSRGLSSCS